MLGIISSGAFLWDARPFLGYALQYLTWLQWEEDGNSLLKISTLPSWSLKSLSSFFLQSALQAKTHPLAQLGWWKPEETVYKELYC